MRFAIIRTGVANLASVRAALNRLDVESRLVESPSELEAPDAVVLPGVGAFDAGIDMLDANGWRPYLQGRYERNEPTLAICLGLQMLCQSSEESSGRAGLGVLPGQVIRFPGSVAVPQFGWNQVRSDGGFFQPGYTYFANSYCLPCVPELQSSGWEMLVCEHGIQFVAAAHRGNWLACQFHPELSGRYGADLLRHWIASFASFDLNASAKVNSC